MTVLLYLILYSNLGIGSKKARLQFGLKLFFKAMNFEINQIDSIGCNESFLRISRDNSIIPSNLLRVLCLSSFICCIMND